MKRYQSSVLAFKPDLRYLVPNLTKDEIKEFILRYKDLEIKGISKKRREWEFSKSTPEQDAIKIFESTNGNSIMVKFSVLGEGLKEDVIKRFGRYLTTDDGTGRPNHDKIVTAIICSLFHITNMNITDSALEILDLSLYANNMDRRILFSETYSDTKTKSEIKAWKTLHIRWALELISFLFDHYKNERNTFKSP